MEVAILVITVFTLLLILLLVTAYTCNRYVCIGSCDGSTDTDSLQDTTEQDSLASSSSAAEHDVIIVVANNNCTSVSGDADDGGERQTAAFDSACADEEYVDDDMTPEVKGRARTGGYQQCPVEMDEKDSEQSFYANDNIEESLL